ncbi:DMT family transporter [Leptothoe sp. PORK10 BA2]|uniref:DMT family transporter n=1 Tax=Leptothoe sp. PORK10 BA2 TaxID=3110254 RepID=UPI002B221965|nr:DMT family transporter [Leptothoe sp. PORK10 BA2]MEA5466132.1 DMT family transporter [Leptothoe sp. PORK10 BA2]
MGLILICLAAVAWGTTGTTSMLIAQQATVSPLVIGFWRMVLALPIFWLWHSYNSRHNNSQNSQHKNTYNNHNNNLGRAQKSPWPIKAHCLPLLTMGLCMGGYQVFYFAAVPYVGVAMTAMVAICSSPLIIALLALVFLGEKLTRVLGISLVLGVTGTLLLIAQPDALAANGGQFLLGVTLALGAAFSYGGYAILAKVMVDRMDGIAIASYSFTAAALLLTPTLVLQPSFDIWLKVLPFLLYLGIITSSFAYGIYMLGIRHTPATVAGIAVLLEPLTASLLGIFVFKEPMGWSSILGALLLMGGILYAQTGNATKSS